MRHAVLVVGVIDINYGKDGLYIEGNGLIVNRDCKLHFITSFLTAQP